LALFGIIHLRNDLELCRVGR